MKKRWGEGGLLCRLRFFPSLCSTWIHFVSLGYKQLEITFDSTHTHTCTNTHVPQGILISTCETVIASLVRSKGLWVGRERDSQYSLFQRYCPFIDLYISFGISAPMFFFFCTASPSVLSRTRSHHDEATLNELLTKEGGSEGDEGVRSR